MFLITIIYECDLSILTLQSTANFIFYYDIYIYTCTFSNKMNQSDYSEYSDIQLQQLKISPELADDFIR